MNSGFQVPSTCHLQHSCGPGQSGQHAAIQQMQNRQTSACKTMAWLCRSCQSASCTGTRRMPVARRALRMTAPSAVLGQSHSSVSRDLLDCWPGCSRASWIEGGPELGGCGSAFAGSGHGVALSAAALAEPPAESATAAEEPSGPEASGNSVTRVRSQRNLASLRVVFAVVCSV
jgi:hypothetical protein